jgi:two-component system response regulator
MLSNEGQPSESRPGKVATILLIEDDPDDAFVFRYTLKKSGRQEELVHVRDGDEAIEYLQGRTGLSELQAMPIVVFLDLKMRKVDGLEVLSWLRAHPEFDEIPIVILSGSARKEDKQATAQFRVTAYRTKPLEEAELNSLLDEICIKPQAKVGEQDPQK